MPSPSTDALLGALRRLELLPPPQLEQFVQRLPKAADAATVGRDLQRLGLSPFQIELLLADRAAELVVGSYKLVDRLGGPTGQVYRACHMRMSRTVALKVLRPDKLTSEEAVAQFYREVETSSRLSHPHLVHAFDAGPVGETHFLATEFVPGHDLGRYVKEKGRVPPGRAREFIRQAAAGLAHAAAYGLVHLGLKPTKLLLTDNGKNKKSSPDSFVKVLDVGLSHLPGRSPEYRAPEQRAGLQGDARADVYSLGAILYFLLTAKPPAPAPYGGPDFPRAQKLVKMPPDLAATLDRMLAASPEDRFPDTNAVVEALGGPAEPESQTTSGQSSATLDLADEPSSMAGLPSEARSMRLQERARAGRRQRFLILGGGAALVLSLVVFVSLMAVGTPRTDAPPPTDTGAEPPKLDPSMALLQTVLARKDAGEHPAKLWRGFLDVRQQYPTSPEALSATAWMGKLLAPLDRLSEDRIGNDDRQLADIQRGRGWLAVLGDQRLRSSTPGVLASALAPSGKTVAACSGGDPFVTLWDVATGKRVQKLKVDAGQPLALAFSADERLLAVGSQHNGNGTVRVWQMPGGTKKADFNPSGSVHRLFFGPKPDQVIIGTGDGVRVWNFGGKSPTKVFESGEVKPVTEMALSADGQLAAVTTPKNKTVRLLDLEHNKYLEVKLDHPADVNALAFSPAGLLACASRNKEIRLWGLDGSPKGVLKGSPAPIRSLVFSPDGKTLYSGAEDGRVVSWDVERQKHAGDLPSALTVGAATALSLSARGLTLAASGPQGNGIGLWDLDKKTALLRPTAGHTRSVTAAAFSPDEQALASIGEDGTLRFWDLSTGDEAPSAPKVAGPLRALVYSPDGKTLYVVAHDGSLELRAPTGETVRAIPPTEPRSSVAVSPGGALLAAGSLNGTVEIWQIESGDKPQHVLKAHPNDKNSGVALSFSPDGKHLATCCVQDKHAKVWSTETGEVLANLPHAGPPTSVAFSVDGKTLYTADADGKVRSWEAPNWKPGNVFPAENSGNAGLVLGLSPDGRYLAVAVTRRSLVRVFELSGSPPREWRNWQLPAWASGVAFAPDSRHLAVPAVNGVIYLFRTGPPGG